jgi:hypothetical protein
MVNIPDAKAEVVTNFKLTPSYLLHEANKVERRPVELSLLERFKLGRLNELQAG